MSCTFQCVYIAQVSLTDAVPAMYMNLINASLFNIVVTVYVIF